MAVKALFVAGVAALALGASSRANAGTQYIDVTTSGTISSGTDTTNLLGLGNSLVGDNYTLSVIYPAPGANYNVDTGSDASDIFDTGLPSSVLLKIANTTQSTIFTISYGASLIQSTTDLVVNTSGADASGNLLSVGQDIFGGSNIFASPDLQTWASYLLTGSDSGTDTYSWSNANDTQSVNFTGTPSSVLIQIPEPVSLSLFGMSLIGMAAARRRRQG